MRTCFVIMLCYLLYYLWRKRLWWAFAVIAVSNFYYVYYEIAKSVMIGGSIYQPELYHTFLF
jgi:hypothetical protein